jgi:hypothetical protein
MTEPATFAPTPFSATNVNALNYLVDAAGKCRLKNYRHARRYKMTVFTHAIHCGSDGAVRMTAEVSRWPCRSTVAPKPHRETSMVYKKAFLD